MPRSIFTNFRHDSVTNRFASHSLPAVHGLRAESLQDADPHAATRCAHTLKGTAGNIGAKAVQAAAGALEQACMDGASSELVDGLLALTLKELAPVMEALQSLEAQSDASVPGLTLPAATPQALDDMLNDLRSRLEIADPTASEIVEHLLPLVAGTPREQLLKQIGQAIEQFEFDEALAALSSPP